MLHIKSEEKLPQYWPSTMDNGQKGYQYPTDWDENPVDLCQKTHTSLESIVCIRGNNTRIRVYQYSSDIYQCNSVQLYTLENLIYTSNEMATSLVFTKGIALKAHQNVQKMSSIVLAYHRLYTQT